MILHYDIFYQFHQKHTSRYFSVRIIRNTELQNIVSEMKFLKFTMSPFETLLIENSKEDLV